MNSLGGLCGFSSRSITGLAGAYAFRFGWSLGPDSPQAPLYCEPQARGAVRASPAAATPPADDSPLGAAALSWF